jgi:IS5 family transposase
MGKTRPADTAALFFGKTGKAAERDRDNRYQGLGKRPEMQEDEQKAGIDCRINEKKGAGRKREKEIYTDPMNHLEYLGEPQWYQVIEELKSKVRSKVGHMFGIMKGIFGFRKVRYRGLKKNLAKPRMIFASANLLKYGWAGSPEWKTAL